MKPGDLPGFIFAQKNPNESDEEDLTTFGYFNEFHRA
jgi:hypothetical protein